MDFEIDFIEELSERLPERLRSELMTRYKIEDPLASQLAIDFIDMMEVADGNLISLNNYFL